MRKATPAAVCIAVVVPAGAVAAVAAALWTPRRTT
jgi:hypothetical protein